MMDFFWFSFFVFIFVYWHCFCLRTLRENQPWASPNVSDRYLTAYYPTVGQISPRTRKSLSLDMGQPSQANTKKLLGKHNSGELGGELRGELN